MFRKELRYYFSTPIAYIVIGLYQLAISLFLWVIPGQWNIIDSGYAQVDGLFQLSPWLFMLLCPALTMRLFSEERQSGIWDLIRTKPISLTRIVLGKYFAAWVLVLIGLLPCFVHYFVVAYMAEPMGNLDSGAFLGSFLGLILLCGTFMAIGLLCATFSKSQIVCFISGALACFILYWVLLQDHYSSLSRGVIDLRDVFFFASVAIVAVIATIFTIDKLTTK
jgi:ABC-2 type transport system permease protein